MTPESRVEAAVREVCAAALAARGARAIALLDDESPEAGLISRWLAPLGDAFVRVREPAPALESLLHAGVPRLEVIRVSARLLDDTLPAHPANKTALLLGGPLPPERLLPLGDLWGSEVEAFCGGWAAAAPVRDLAERCGGIASLDAALKRWIDGRDPSALDALPASCSDEVRARFAAGRADRIQPIVVPKLTYRTLALDLFE